MTRGMFDRPRYILNHAWLTSHIVYTIVNIQNVQNICLVQQLLSFIASKTFKNERLVCSVSIVQNICNVSIVYNIQNVSIIRVMYLK